MGKNFLKSFLILCVGALSTSSSSEYFQAFEEVREVREKKTDQENYSDLSLHWTSNDRAEKENTAQNRFLPPRVLTKKDALRATGETSPGIYLARFSLSRPEAVFFEKNLPSSHSHFAYREYVYWARHKTSPPTKSLHSS